MRPALSPGLRRLWRDRESLQLGTAPGRAVVLTGVDPGTRAALGLLDGTRDHAQLLAAAAACGCPPPRTQALLDLLAAAGALEAPTGEQEGPALDRTERQRLRGDLASLALLRRGDGSPAGRRQVAVQVRGAGRVGAAVASGLAQAGVALLDVDDPATARPEDTGPAALTAHDVGRTRGDALRDRLREVSPSADLAPQRTPDLVVLAPVQADDLDAAARLVALGVPHLVARVQDTVGVVGPLVLPGRSACLRCLDLVRTDRDPGWPAVAAQLATPGRATEAGDGALALAVAATAVSQVLHLLDGTAPPAALDGTLELALPDWRWRRRSWTPHPACECRSRAA